MALIPKGSNGVAFLVAAGIVAEIIAKACSSPQTQELNFPIRGGTARKWVYIGLGESVLFIAIAAKVEENHKKAIIAGGTLAAVITLGEYMYAEWSGARKPGQPTESWDSGT